MAASQSQRLRRAAQKATRLGSLVSPLGLPQPRQEIAAIPDQ
jgi:hypothetical protein